MTQIGEPYDWNTPWEGTEYEEMINQLLEDAENETETAEKLSKLEQEVRTLKEDYRAFQEDYIRTVRLVFERISFLNS